jgi:hypothetical protein
MISNHSPSATGVVRPLIPGFKTLAIVICAVVLSLPASAQLHIQQPQMPTPVLPAAPAEMRGWPDALTPDLIALRSTSSPAEKKLSFNLFLITRKQRKAPIAAFASLMDTRAMNSDGSVNVEIIAYLSPSLMASPVMEHIVRVNGGSIPLPSYVSDHFQAKVYPWQLLDLAANPNVLSIRDIDSAPVNARVAPGTAPLYLLAAR